MKKKKMLAGLVAAACATSLLVAGTLTWFSASGALNEFMGTEKPKNPSGNLHDDFNSATGDKNVYVENTGDTEIFVRLSLGEYLQIGDATKPTNPNYTIHKPTNSSLVDCENEQDGNKFHGDSYFNWTLGNTAADNVTYIPAYDKTKAEAGDEAYYSELKDKVFKTDTPNPENGTALPTAEVISMTDYNKKTDAQKEAFAGWIYDHDGYVYWSQPLAPGAATGLLLNNVTMPDPDTLTYWYGIDVKMEVVDIKDLPMWTNAGTDGTRTEQANDKGQVTITGNPNGAVSVMDNTSTHDEASADAKAMLNKISKTDTAFAFDSQSVSMQAGETKDSPKTTPEKKPADLQWTSSDSNVATVGADGKVTAKAPGTATITATDPQTGATASYTVTVTAAPVPDQKVSIDTATAPDKVEQGQTVDGPKVTTDPADTKVTWTSSDPSIATVDPSTGEVTGVKPGKVTVTVTTEDGKGTASYEIEVTEPKSKLDDLIKTEVKDNDYTYNADTSETENGFNESIKLTQHDGSILPDINDMELFYLYGPEDEYIASGYNVQLRDDNTESYGYIPFSRITDSDEVQFATGDSKYITIDNANKQIVVHYKPTYREFMQNGNLEWHPKVPIILSLGDEKKEVNIAVSFMGAIEDVTMFPDWVW